VAEGTAFSSTLAETIRKRCETAPRPRTRRFAEMVVFIVAAPSLHASGNRYEWMAGRGGLENWNRPNCQRRGSRNYANRKHKPVCRWRDPPRPDGTVQTTCAHLPLQNGGRDLRLRRPTGRSGAQRKPWCGGFWLSERATRTPSLRQSTTPRCVPPLVGEGAAAQDPRRGSRRAVSPWGYLLEGDRPLPPRACGARLR